MSSAQPHEITLSAHPARLEEGELLKECELSFGKASGPGGQHRNKVETAVRIVHRPSGIEASASERRSQRDNRRTALFRLRIRLAVKFECSPASGEMPSALWSSRCRGGKIDCSPEHHDAPALLAEAMTACRLHGFVHQEAARQLECTATQFLKFLAKYPEAREELEKSRAVRGLPRLNYR
jgi:hypothetical protein